MRTPTKRSPQLWKQPLQGSTLNLAYINPKRPGPRPRLPKVASSLPACGMDTDLSAGIDTDINRDIINVDAAIESEKCRYGHRHRYRGRNFQDIGGSVDTDRWKARWVWR